MRERYAVTNAIVLGISTVISIFILGVLPNIIGKLLTFCIAVCVLIIIILTAKKIVEGIDINIQRDILRNKYKRKHKNDV